MKGFHNNTQTIVLVLLVTFLPSQTFGENYQCDIDGNNRLGLEEAIEFLRNYSGTLTESPTDLIDCGQPMYDISNSGELSIHAKTYILCRINKIRSRVALGLVPDDGSAGFYPIAKNMQRMKWDHDLANVAQNYASQCNFAHNPNLSNEYSTLTGIMDPHVGENIAVTGTSWTIDSATAVAAIETALSDWNGENDVWYYDTINSQSWAAGIGHFTQNIWAETTMVGCGQAWCPNSYPNNNNLNMVLTVCNYYTAGNWQGEYPYESGDEVCSDNLFVGDTCENGLITPADYGTNLAYGCDINGDGKPGLEEVVNALRAVTGTTP